MAWIPGVRGALLDVDGTLLHGERAIPGAAPALDALRRAGIAFRLTTNTTRHACRVVHRMLCDAGIAVAEDAILTPAILARRRILESGAPRAALLVSEAARPDFDGIEPTFDDPSWVVLGDLGREFTWDVLNRAFRALLGGARLLALQKNRYWHAGDEGLLLDAGAFVAALEFAAGVEAEIVGKPARGFFDAALSALGVPAHQVVVVGDDLVNDAGGGMAAGCHGVLVRTGKFSQAELDRSAIQPSLVVDSIADLQPE